mgnify:CR=1 FL=1
MESLPTQKHLIDEITKIKRVIKKCHDSGPQEILLVIDANTGQNGLQQAKIFHEHLNINGLILTKLDGTAKGGIVFAIQDMLNVPIYFVGNGEKLEDLSPFVPEDFVTNLLKESQTN